MEKHKLDCTCTYCRGKDKLHFGLNIPIHWNSWNAWYVIKVWRGCYIRWTNSWFKKVGIDRRTGLENKKYDCPCLEIAGMLNFTSKGKPIQDCCICKGTGYVPDSKNMSLKI